MKSNHTEAYFLKKESSDIFFDLHFNDEGFSIRSGFKSKYVEKDSQKFNWLMKALKKN